MLGAACGRIGFEVDWSDAGASIGDAASGDGVPDSVPDSVPDGGGSLEAMFQSASQSAPCSSGCNTGASHPINHTLVPGCDRLLVVFSGCGEDGLTPSTATYGGVPMTRLGGLVDYGNFSISDELFYMTESQLGAMTDAPHTVTFPPTCYAGIAMQFQGVDQSNPIGELVAVGSEAEWTTRIDVATADTNALIVDGVSAGRSGDRAMSVPASSTAQIERGNVQYNSNSGAGYSVSTRPWQANPTSLTRDLAADSYPFEVHVGAAIHPAP